LKIYLDSCALNRPYDKYLNEEIATEAKLIIDIFELIDQNILSLVDSEVLDAECQLIPDEDKKARVNAVRSRARYYVKLSPYVKKRAKTFLQYGIKPMDALQIASAEKGADIFITVDKRLLKKAKKIPTLQIEVFSPSEFWRYYENQRTKR